MLCVPEPVCQITNGNSSPTTAASGLSDILMKSQFLLDPTITFLNHGSFGACPKPIFEEYQRFQKELETEPVYFLIKKHNSIYIINLFI